MFGGKYEGVSQGGAGGTEKYDQIERKTINLQVEIEIDRYFDKSCLLQERYA